MLFIPLRRRGKRCWEQWSTMSKFIQLICYKVWNFSFQIWFYFKVYALSIILHRIIWLCKAMGKWSLNSHVHGFHYNGLNNFCSIGLQGDNMVNVSIILGCSVVIRWLGILIIDITSWMNHWTCQYFICFTCVMGLITISTYTPYAASDGWSEE